MKTSKILNDIIKKLRDARVCEVQVGLHWTAVEVERKGKRSCGLAASGGSSHSHSKDSEVPGAGKLQQHSGLELAQWINEDNPVRAGIGLAAINALLEHNPADWSEENAEELLSRMVADRKLAIIGHFPFTSRLRNISQELVVLELNPQPDDLPAEMASQVLPAADVIAITGMTLVNHTLEELLEMASPKAHVIVLGPSTPLCSVLFDYGVEVISGAVVQNIESVLETVSQGGDFHQVHQSGVKLVNMVKPI